MMRNVLIPLVALLALACASAQRPDDIPEPEIGLRQSAPIFFGSSPSAPVSFDILIRNSSDVVLTVREVQLASMGSSQYAILPASRRLSRSIAPGEVETIGISATAVNRSVRGTPSERPSMRWVVIFLTPEGERFREVGLHHRVGD